MGGLLAVVVTAVLVGAFGAFLVWGSSLLGPKTKVTATKMMPYECGLPGQDANDTKISVKFYLTAILFILFDIEIIFMYPWAITFFESIKSGHGIYYASVMGFFLLLFVLGLLWEVKSRALDWN